MKWQRPHFGGTHVIQRSPLYSPIIANIVNWQDFSIIWYQISYWHMYYIIDIIFPNSISHYLILVLFYSGCSNSYRSGWSHTILRACRIWMTYDDFFARRILYCCRSCIIFTAVRSTLLLLHFQLHSLCFCNQPVSAWFCCMLCTGQLLGMLGIKIISYNIYRYKTLRANIILYFFACKATHLIGCWVAASLWLVWLVRLVWLVTLCDVTFSSFFHMWLQPGATVSLIYCIPGKHGVL